jgi:hypothetical protein
LAIPREILDRTESQPAQALLAEIGRFLKHKLETNRFSKTSADTNGFVLKILAEAYAVLLPGRFFPICANFWELGHPVSVEVLVHGETLDLTSDFPGRRTLAALPRLPGT